MSQRLDYAQVSPELFKAYLGFAASLQSSTIDHATRELVKLRVSQMNGCAFCVDLHVKAATKAGERPLRLHHVAIWRESPLFSARERACFAWAETLTKLAPGGASDDIYQAVRAELSEKEITDLTYQIMEINGWNRACVAFRTTPGVKDEAYGIANSGLS